MTVDATITWTPEATSVALVRNGNTLLSQAASPHPDPAVDGRPKAAEQEADRWLSALRSAWTAAMAEASTPQVGTMRVAGVPGALVVLDADGAVLRPAKLASDSETAPDAEWLASKVEPAIWADAWGEGPTAALTITKLSWLHRSEPEAWQRLARVCSPPEWLTYCLTGRLVTTSGLAAATGWWSASEGRIRPDLLAVVDGDRDWPAILPELVDPSALVGRWDGRWLDGRAGHDGPVDVLAPSALI